MALEGSPPKTKDERCKVVSWSVSSISLKILCPLSPIADFFGCLLFLSTISFRGVELVAVGELDNSSPGDHGNQGRGRDVLFFGYRVLRHPHEVSTRTCIVLLVLNSSNFILILHQ